MALGPSSIDCDCSETMIASLNVHLMWHGLSVLRIQDAVISE